MEHSLLQSSPAAITHSPLALEAKSKFSVKSATEMEFSPVTVSAGATVKSDRSLTVMEISDVIAFAAFNVTVLSINSKALKASTV